MQTIKVQQGQTLLDIAMQGNGDASQAFGIAAQNGMSVTDDIKIDSSLSASDTDATKQNIVDALAGIYPASATQSSTSNPNLPQGIGYWTIGKDFKVS